MAQDKMPALAVMVRDIYLEFPSETWEKTRKVLDTSKPFLIYTHVESLIHTRKCDAALKKHEDFRLLASSIWSSRYPWLRDADLGAAQWRAYQDFRAADLTRRSMELRADPEKLEKKAREMMLNKIREDDHVDEWRKILGFEGVQFSKAEIMAGEERPAYGEGEFRESNRGGGVEIGGVLDGPDGSYGEMPHVGITGAIMAGREKVPELAPRVPLAPGDGGEPLKNPFTTDWRPREAPDGWVYPAIFDPYFTSNQFITRAKPYELPPIPDDDSPVDEEGDTRQDDGSRSTAMVGAARPSTSTTKNTNMPYDSRSDISLPLAEMQRRRQMELEMQMQAGTTSNNWPSANVGHGFGVVPGTSVPIVTVTDTSATNPTSSAAFQPSSTTSQTFPSASTAPFTHPPWATTKPSESTAPTTHSSWPTSLPLSSTTNPIHLPASTAPIANPQFGPSTQQPPTLQLPLHFPRVVELPDSPKDPDQPIFTPPRELIPLSPPPPPTPPTQSPISDDITMSDTTIERADPGRTAPESEKSWLIKFLFKDFSVPTAELAMTPYRGWRVHSPQVQLLRIKNFLADEDIDRTLGWERKFADIGLYLKHCAKLPDAPTRCWWPDLRECTSMLHTHWVFEQYHYGTRPLVVSFARGKTVSTRLPAIAGARSVALAAAPAASERVRRARYLLHRCPESVHDVDYQIPGPLLRKTFLTWFRDDGNVVWRTDPAIERAPGSGSRGAIFEYKPDFNMVTTEERWYEKCMAGGPAETAKHLRGEANFYLLHDEFIGGEVSQFTDEDGKVHSMQRRYPEGEVLQRFARYRGAKRAALQQCISHFDSIENVALLSPFRKLVLPLTQRQKMQAKIDAGQGIVYKPQGLRNPPPNVKLDPLGLTSWFSFLRESHYRRAAAARNDVDDSHTKMMEMLHEDKDPVLTTANYLGPVTPMSFLREGEQDDVQRFRRLCTLRDMLKRAYNRSPRQMLEGMIRNIDLGFDKADSWDMRDELREHREQHGTYLPVTELDLKWLEFVCSPSTNVKMQQEPLPKIGKEFEVFSERVRLLLDDPNLGSLLAARERKASLAQVTHAVNCGLRKGDYVFDEEKTRRFCKIMADFGRLGYHTTDTGEARISRAYCDWHPENLADWPENDEPWEPFTNMWDAANLPDPDRNWTWEEAFSNISFVNTNRMRTKIMLWSRSYRVGVEMASLVPKLNALDNTLATPSEWDYRALQLQDVLGQWRHRFEEHGDGRNPSVTYKAVVKGGHRNKWTEKMTEEEAYEVVRKGVIDELSAGDAALWPSRPRFGQTRMTGETELTFHRERIWSWAAPEVAGPKKQFFSINRWPLHLQTPKRQEEILRSLDDERLAKEKEMEEEEMEMERVEKLNPPSEEEVGRREIEGMLKTKYHEGAREEFVPETELWVGDTKLKRKALERHVRRTVAAAAPDDGKAPVRTTWFGRRVDAPREVLSEDEDDIKLPEIASPDVPKSIPGSVVDVAWERLSRSRPGPESAPIVRRQPKFAPRPASSPVEETLPETPRGASRPQQTEPQANPGLGSWIAQYQTTGQLQSSQGTSGHTAAWNTREQSASTAQQHSTAQPQGNSASTEQSIPQGTDEQGLGQGVWDILNPSTWDTSREDSWETRPPNSWETGPSSSRNTGTSKHVRFEDEV
ncbi:hypothetical protein C8035_v004371 [Colletotrichum spinosum]|uniref:Uncharacterized protein n=1 Tax=Colletotrichum spinosum TaxID=1347390 RepID=A0A4R8PM29_9PEZI|nr:hypothetical protein C8035_v004371 [Colletotrichum spinosum]